MDSSNMASDPAEAAGAGLNTGLIRKIVIGTVLVLVAAFAFLIWQAVQDEQTLDKWDTLEAIRLKHEPRQDPIWENPYGVYNDERKKYIGALDAFLAGEAAQSGDALTPHTRFLLAKTIADHILANPGILNQDDRAAFYEKATKQLATIRDDHPDFPLNWTMLSQDGFPNLTRQFIKWLEDNQNWEQEHMLAAVEPDAGVRVLVRTNRGDMLFGLYGKLAPSWTQAFVEQAKAGVFDGMTFVEKRDVGDASEPGEHGFRTGGAASRGLEPYDTAAAKTASEIKVRAGILPEESRNRIPLDRGIVAVWHDGTDDYDTKDGLFFITSRSPFLDYKYTSIGKLVDESGVKSLLTADRIFGGGVWREDDLVREDSELRGLMDWFQVPVTIVKVLVYQDGTLQEPAKAADTRAKVEDSERSLASIKADRHAVEPPAKPVVPKKDGDDKDAKDAPKKDE